MLGGTEPATPGMPGRGPAKCIPGYATMLGTPGIAMGPVPGMAMGPVPGMAPLSASPGRNKRLIAGTLVPVMCCVPAGAIPGMRTAAGDPGPGMRAMGGIVPGTVGPRAIPIGPIASAPNGP